MSYFANRPRAYSKPTKEETKELSNFLAKCSAHELRLIMLSAAGESSIVAHSFMKIMKDASLIPNPHLQPVQPNQQHTIPGSFYSDTGLLTPIDVSEDSEMSGTENIQPQTQHHLARPESFVSSEFISLKRPNNKRKSLEDRDDNTSSYLSPPIHPLVLSKRRKPSNQPSQPESTPEKTYCLNCGLWTSNSKFENLHGCIYHPGDFKFDGAVCSWSCCGNSDLKSRGCLVTRHMCLPKDAWLNQYDHANDLPHGQGRTTEAVDHGQMSQYARIISMKC